MRSGSMKSLSTVGPALVPVPDTVWAQALSDADRYVWGPHMMWWDGGWYAMILGPLFTILFLAVLITAVVLLAHWLGGSWHGPALSHHTRRAVRPLTFLKSALRAARSIKTSSRSGGACSVNNQSWAATATRWSGISC